LRYDSYSEIPLVAQSVRLKSVFGLMSKSQDVILMVQPLEDIINQFKSKWIRKLKSMHLEPTDEGIKAFVDDISRILKENPDQIEKFRRDPEKLEREVEGHVAYVRKSVSKFLPPAKAGEPPTGVVDAQVISIVRALCGSHRPTC
jgi:hypothetical protein